VDPLGKLRRHRPARLASALAGSLVGCLVIAACGSSGASATGSGQGGDTYKVMVISNSVAGPKLAEAFPQIADGAKAGALAVNAAGGVNGRKVQIQTCETKGDPNAAVECARQAITEHLPAVVGSFDLVGTYLSVLQSAGIPAIGSWPVAEELTNPIAYPVWGGGTGITAAMISYLVKQKHAKSIALVLTDTAADSQIPAVVAPIVAANPGVKVNEVIIPANTVDYSAVVAKALQNQGIALGAEPTDVAAFLKALGQSGQTRPLVASVAAIPESFISQLPDSADGMYGISGFLPASLTSNSAVATFNRYMNAVDPTADKDNFAENAYASVLLFADAVKGLHTVDGSTVTQALQTTGSFNLGLLPPVSFRRSQAPIAALTRFFNPDVMYVQLQNQTWIAPTTQFYNAYTGAPTAG